MQEEVPAVEIGDLYIKADLSEWTIFDMDPDPSNAVWQLFVRKQKAVKV
jgi:hypothetical protein